MGWLKLYLGQAVNEVVPSRLDDIEVRRFCQATRKTGLERLYYWRVFCEDAMVDYPVLKYLELMARDTLTWKVVSAKVVWYDAEQWAPMPKLENRVEYYKGLGNKRRTRGEAGSCSGSSGEESSPKPGNSPEMRTLEKKYKNEE